MAAHGITLRYCTAAGDEVETPLDLARPDAIVGGLPIRTPPSYPGRTSYPGFFWSATTGRVHVYESLLELDRLWLADFDPAVGSLTTQPFQAIGSDGDVVRSHVPDLMLMSPDHRVTVVDVKPSAFLDLPKVKAQFDWTRRWCDERGWGYEVFSDVRLAPAPLGIPSAPNEHADRHVSLVDRPEVTALLQEIRRCIEDAAGEEDGGPLTWAPP